VSHVAIVLAGGGSTRMGRPKQLLTFGGRSLLRRAAESALAAGCSPVIVVLGPGPVPMKADLAGLAVETIVNPRWETGIGSSIRCGVGRVLALPQRPNAAVLMLCDQPMVGGNCIARLIETFDNSRKPVCISAYSNTVGPPLIVAESLFGELLSLPDDQGAKGIWSAHPEWVCTVSCPEGAADVDTPHDLKALLSRH
jgi:molybdenum cofactor cytidylyltransferase